MEGIDTVADTDTNTIADTDTVGRRRNLSLSINYKLNWTKVPAEGKGRLEGLRGRGAQQMWACLRPHRVLNAITL